MRTERLEERVANLDCDSDAARIRRSLEGLCGLVETSVNSGAAKVTLVYDPDATSPESLRDKLDDLGFPVQAGGVPPGQPRPWRNPRTRTASRAGPP